MNVVVQLNIYQHTHSHARTRLPEVLGTQSFPSEILPSDGGEDGVDEVEECSNVGEDLKHPQTCLRACHNVNKAAKARSFGY